MFRSISCARRAAVVRTTSDVRLRSFRAAHLGPSQSRKHGSIGGRVGIAGLCIACALCGALSARANTPMQEFIDLTRTDYVVAGVGGIAAPYAEQGGKGELTLAGVSGTVTLALLYWNGIDIEMPPEFTGGNGDYDEPEINFDGEDIVGTRVAGFNGNDCWPLVDGPPSAALYRADVTAFVQARGNGEYIFSGLSDHPGHSANGMSLIVYFNDGNPANDLHVTHYEGMQSSVGAMSFEFPLDYTGGAVAAIVHVSDGQSVLNDGELFWRARPDVIGSTEHSIRYRGFLHDGLLLWPGTSVPMMPHGRGNGPGLWDIRRMPLTPIFGPLGRYNSRITYTGGADCVSLQVAQIARPADPQLPALSPNPFDFGDVVVGAQSAPQRFTLKNPMPGPITIGTVVSNAAFPVVAQTCSGQTLPASATCTVDVAFQPSAVSLPVSRELKINFTDATFVTTAAQWFFVELHGAGIPDVPFSRVETQPVDCTFEQGQVSVASAPVPMHVASTGTLPVTITSARMNSGAVPPFFTLVNDDCVGSTLQPGSSCTVNLSATRSRTGTSSDNLVLNYTAADPNPGGVSIPVTGVAYAATSDRMFDDGFDPGQCIE